MKSVRFFNLLIVAFLAFPVAAQIKVFDQRFQVENMPQPKSITSYNTFAIPNEKLSAVSGDYEYPRRYHRLTANVIPIANNERIIMSIGFGYATDRFESNSAPIRQINQALWAQLYTTGSIGDNYYWRWIYAFGTYGQHISFDSPNAYKHTLNAHFGRKWNSNLATSVGLLYLSNYGDAQYLPTAHILYSTGKFVFDLYIPSEISLRYIQGNNLHFLLVNTIIRRSYYEPQFDLAYRYSINEVGLQAEWRINGMFWIELSVTKPYGLKTELQDNKDYTEIGDVQQTLSINGGLFVRFQETY